MKKQFIAFLLAIGLMVFGVIDTQAAEFVYFGTDTGAGENARVAYPNALNASNQFQAGLVGVGTENFEGFSVGASVPLALTFPGAGNASLTGSGAIAQVTNATGTNGFGRYPISGTQYWQTETGMTVNFASPVAAFGFYGVDIGDFDGDLVLNFSSGLTKTFTLNTANRPGGSVLFWGIIETTDTFQQIIFNNTNPGTDVFAFDDMTIGSLEQVRVPEPSSMLLIGCGLLGLVAARRRMRK